MKRKHFRSVWISDVHLGTRGCRAEYLVEFLRATTCDRLYVVGDFIDLWAMQRAFYWDANHTEVLRTVLKKARDGTEVIYIPGNHDAALREYAGLVVGNLRIALEAIHTTADQRHFLVIHGDQFDGAVQCGRWAHAFGDAAYGVVLAIGNRIHRLRQRLGLSYWSLAGFLKRRVAEAARYMARFDEAVAREAERRGVDGLICGHIHRAQIHSNLRGIVYCNDGDWVENCTALVEHTDGTLELLHWSDRRHSISQVEPQRKVA